MYIYILVYIKNINLNKKINKKFREQILIYKK